METVRLGLEILAVIVIAVLIYKRKPTQTVYKRDTGGELPPDDDEHKRRR